MKDRPTAKETERVRVMHAHNSIKQRNPTMKKKKRSLHKLRMEHVIHSGACDDSRMLLNE